MNFDALVWQQWVILGYALLEHFILIGTLRETKAKPGERLCTSRSGSSFSTRSC